MIPLASAVVVVRDSSMVGCVLSGDSGDAVVIVALSGCGSADPSLSPPSLSSTASRDSTVGVMGVSEVAGCVELPFFLLGFLFFFVFESTCIYRVKSVRACTRGWGWVCTDLREASKTCLWTTLVDLGRGRDNRILCILVHFNGSPWQDQERCPDCTLFLRTPRHQLEVQMVEHVDCCLT